MEEETSTSSACALQADAFRKLYPTTYLSRFLSEGIRPDGRPLGCARATTIGRRALSTVDGSSLVKVGSTTALAGVKLELGRPSEATPDQGSITFNVEAAPFSAADYRPGRPPEYISAISERLHSILLGCGVLQLQQLSVASSKHCWNATVDVYVLDADGAVFDVVLLAVVAALLDVLVPGVTISKEGQAHRSAAGEKADTSESRLQLGAVPVSLTCCLYQDQVLADPTAEEEAVSAGLLTTVIDKAGRLYGAFRV